MKTRILIPLMAGLVFLWACKGKSTSSDADTTSSIIYRGKNIIPNTDSILNGAKLIKTANINFKVKNVQKTSEQIISLTESYHGMVIHHLMGTTAGRTLDIQLNKDSIMRVSSFNTTAEMTVKIPPEKMEDFLNQVSQMGIYVNNLKMDIDDKSLDYLSTRMKLKNQKELLDQQKNVNPGLKDPDNLLAFKNNMVDQQIGNRKIDDSVKNSIVGLSFYQSNIINREIIANEDLSTYNPSFFKRVEIATGNGWRVFEDIFITIANFWILIPLGWGIWILIRYNKRKKISRLAKTEPV